MDYGNVGPGNRIAQDFERLSEEQDFNPDKTPERIDQNEQDPAVNSENIEDNLNRDEESYDDSGKLGTVAVRATEFGGETGGLGKIVSEGPAGMKELTESQIIGTDIDISKFDKNGVSKELADRLDNLKKEPDLHKQSVEFVLESKKSLASSFSDRGYLASGGEA